MSHLGVPGVGNLIVSPTSRSRNSHTNRIKQRAVCISYYNNKIPRSENYLLRGACGVHVFAITEYII